MSQHHPQPGYGQPTQLHPTQPYPAQPSPDAPAPGRRMAVPLWAIVGAGVVALCVIGGAVVTVATLATRDGGSSEQAAVSAPPPAQTTSASPGPATDHPQAPDQPANPDGPPTLQVGESADDSVGSLAVTAAQRYTEPSSRFGERPENDVFLQVTIHAEAAGDEVYRVSASDFYIRDSDGRQYDYGGGNSLFEGASTASASLS